MVYDVDEGGDFANGRLFHDATEWVPKAKGLPDGLKVDTKGNIYATGPGGVWIFKPDGTLLGKIKTGQATANCALDLENNVLFMTADKFVFRLKLRE